MKKVNSTKISAIVLAALISTTALSGFVPSGNNFGLGVILGEPSGLSAKYFFNKRHAIDGAIASSLLNDGGLHIHAAYNWHLWDVVTSKVPLPLYLGIGGVLVSRNFGNNKNKSSELGLGARGQSGLEFFFEKVPVSIFGEVAINLYIIPSVKADLGGALGARYYFP